MAHAPSGRNHRVKPNEELNLVPMIDMVTNLMFFLMMFASVLPVMIIDAPLPKIASTAEEVKKAKDEPKTMDVNIAITAKGFGIKVDGAGEHNIPMLGTEYNYAELHKFLVQLKSRKSSTDEITMVPTDDVQYAVMIRVMDEARELVKGDPGFQAVPPEIAQKPESMQFNRLFPKVSIGGV